MLTNRYLHYYSRQILLLNCRATSYWEELLSFGDFDGLDYGFNLEQQDHDITKGDPRLHYFLGSQGALVNLETLSVNFND